MSEMARTPAAYQELVKATALTALRRQDFDAITAADLESVKGKFYSLEQRAAHRCLVQRKQKAEQRTKDKQLLEATYAQWLADGKPTTSVSKQGDGFTLTHALAIVGDK